MYEGVWSIDTDPGSTRRKTCPKAAFVTINSKSTEVPGVEARPDQWYGI
jgi:hypothetical protein